jgi:phosphatidylglycerophosphate synthase
VLLVVVSRDIIILTGSGIILMIQDDVWIKPTCWGKLTTFFQMMTIVALIIEFKFSAYIWWTASIFTIVSGFDYARKGINTLNSSPGLKQ